MHHRTMNGAASEAAELNSAQFYHVWFATRRRKWLLQGDVEERVKTLLRELAAQHQIELLALETVVDHVHLLIRLQQGQSLSSCLHLLKGGSARRVFQEFPDVKLDAHTEHFWQKRFESKRVPPTALETVRRYIETQKERPEKYDRY
jgi:putative transposase